MNAKVSLLVKRLLPVACVFMVISITILSSGSSIDANTLSHQPTTFEQMERLVMPQDQMVTQTLSQALGDDSTSSAGNTSSAAIAINRIRSWVFSSVSETTDFALHGVDDYWQTPVETLTLKAGDCEDFAILMVSLMRAYGVPKDQAYVAVGYDLNKNWHAFVVERYSYGAWIEFDPENLDDAMLLGGNETLPYNISYCFNDQYGFHGLPAYPPGYTVPTVSVIPVGPITPATIYIYNIKSKNSSLDEIKQHLGELWLPTSMPQDYIFLLGGGLYSNDEWILMLEYQSGTGSQLLITEHPEIGPLQVGSLPLGTIEQITINNQPAFLDLSTIGTGVSSSPILKSMLLLDFSRGNLEIRIGVIPADSFTGEELIAIAESLVKY